MKKIAFIITAILMCALAAMPVMAAARPEGYYVAQTGSDRYEFQKDGTVNYNGSEGAYTINGNELTIVIGGFAYKYTYEFMGDMLILYGADGVGQVFDKIDPDQMLSRIRNAKAGDIVYLGTYEQDNNLDNGQEPIEWEVLDIQDGKAFLVSKYALDSQPYNEEWADVTWETCTLRSWLNGEFLNTAFDPSEANAIVETNVVNADNAYYETEGGNDTVDKVFLLCLDDMEKYCGVGPDEWDSGDNYTPQESLVCRLTDYGVRRIKEQYINVGSTTKEAEEWYQDIEKRYGQNVCWWWLRSPGYDGIYAAYVNFDGGVFDRGISVDYDYFAVRPALWVNLES